MDCQILVLPHWNLRVNFFDLIQHDWDDDEERRAAEGNRGNSCNRAHNERQDRDKAEEKRAQGGDAAQNFWNILRSGKPGADAGDKGAVFLQIIGECLRIEGDRGVEISEKKN